MPTLEIPQQEWPSFFQRFTTNHGGWTCSIEILGNELGAQTYSRGLPLTDIGAEAAPKGTTQITISLGGRSNAHVTHVIDAPSAVWLLQDGLDHEDVLEIQGRGLRTLLRFHKDAQ